MSGFGRLGGGGWRRVGGGEEGGEEQGAEEEEEGEDELGFGFDLGFGLGGPGGGGGEEEGEGEGEGEEGGEVGGAVGRGGGGGGGGVVDHIRGLVLAANLVEMLFVVCTMMTGKVKIMVQDRMAKCGLIGSLGLLFDALDWKVRKGVKRNDDFFFLLCFDSHFFLLFLKFRIYTLGGYLTLTNMVTIVIALRFFSAFHSFSLSSPSYQKFQESALKIQFLRTLLHFCDRDR